MEDSKNGEDPKKDNKEAVGGRGATLPMKLLLTGLSSINTYHNMIYLFLISTGYEE